ncbi:MAG: sigma 54-interacting transcriptional regulator [Eubacteriales bacterium]|nr:sigma 54-interacting transcriptional regulator [Eubacteriales bacterium]
MFDRFGINRVIEPKHVLTTSAWKIDNSRKVGAKELRVSIRKLHIEGTSFKQICIEANNDPERIINRIMDIVIRRGKLHNPVTDTGGVLYGIVEEVGSAYENPKGLKPGDEVICNASLAAIPLYISRITKIDMAYSQIEAEGYAILFEEFPISKPPQGLPVSLLLYAYDESGTLYAVNEAAKGKNRFLVVGSNLLTNLLYGYAARKAAGPDAQIICLFDNKSDIMLKGKNIDALLSKVFTEIHHVNILRPIECLRKLNAEGLFDMSINCADIPGAETINILATRYGGTVFFANLINNYNIALYITEAISRQLTIRCAEGYVEEYDEFDNELVRELAPYFAQATYIGHKVYEDVDYPLGRANKSLEISGYRKSLAEGFICESRAMALLLDEILSVAKYDCNVLIMGETGVGKERVASIIQKNSTRKMQPFVKINCASIAENLIESELFGYEKGSFTGANPMGKKGYFEQADNGIIFLDEVGELPLDMQAKLLRVIQDGEFYRVGGTQPVKTNVRILSATNRNLEEAVDAKQFRRDLYYRLNVFPIRVPPLDERRAEIPALVRHFIEQYNKKFGIERNITEDAIEALQARNWPGNIRELENVVQRLLITARGESITAFDVMRSLHSELFEHVASDDAAESLEQAEGMNLNEMIEQFEKHIVLQACEKHGSSRKAAKALGISQTQLIRKKNKYQE